VDVLPDLDVAADEAVGEEATEDGESGREQAAEEEEKSAAIDADGHSAHQHVRPPPHHLRHHQLQPTQRPSVPPAGHHSLPRSPVHSL